MAESASKLARCQLGESKASDAPSAYSGVRDPIMNAPNGFALAREQIAQAGRVGTSRNRKRTIAGNLGGGLERGSIGSTGPFQHTETSQDHQETSPPWQ